MPAKTRVPAHTHRDDLPAGSYYTEPPRRAHFAETRDEPVIVQISGVGPSDTEFIKSDNNEH